MPHLWKDNVPDQEMEIFLKKTPTEWVFQAAMQLTTHLHTSAMQVGEATKAVCQIAPSPPPC